MVRSACNKRTGSGTRPAEVRRTPFRSTLPRTVTTNSAPRAATPRPARPHPNSATAFASRDPEPHPPRRHGRPQHLASTRRAHGNAPARRDDPGPGDPTVAEDLASREPAGARLPRCKENKMAPGRLPWDGRAPAARPAPPELPPCQQRRPQGVPGIARPHEATEACGG